MDVPALERAFHRLRADAAVGVDGVSKAQYGQALEANLEELYRRLKTKRYRHQPLRRVSRRTLSAAIRGLIGSD